MFIVFSVGGKQYHGKIGDFFNVDKVNTSGELLTDALLIKDEKGVLTTYTSKDSKKVKLRVVENFKGPKVIAFKKRRRKGYQRKKGFRAQYTKVELLGIA